MATDPTPRESDEETMHAAGGRKRPLTSRKTTLILGGAALFLAGGLAGIGVMQFAPNQSGPGGGGPGQSQMQGGGDAPGGSQSEGDEADRSGDESGSSGSEGSGSEGSDSGSGASSAEDADAPAEG